MFDHIDLRVRSFADVEDFYNSILPELGFLRKVDVDGWLQYESAEEFGPFFGITESPEHVPNENRIALAAKSEDEVNRLGTVIARAGAINIEGPMPYEPGYYAVFFEDPVGNRFEICHRYSA